MSYMTVNSALNIFRFRNIDEGLSPVFVFTSWLYCSRFLVLTTLMHFLYSMTLFKHNLYLLDYFFRGQCYSQLLKYMLYIFSVLVCSFPFANDVDLVVNLVKDNRTMFISGTEELIRHFSTIMRCLTSCTIMCI